MMEITSIGDVVALFGVFFVAALITSAFNSAKGSN